LLLCRFTHEPVTAARTNILGNLVPDALVHPLDTFVAETLKIAHQTNPTPRNDTSKAQRWDSGKSGPPGDRGNFPVACAHLQFGRAAAVEVYGQDVQRLHGYSPLYNRSSLTRF
jgi:hypothetical protein